VGCASGGVFAGVVVLGLVFWLLPPTMEETIGARMGIERKRRGV
jgi:hypothetical protein